MQNVFSTIFTELTPLPVERVGRPRRQVKGNQRRNAGNEVAISSYLWIPSSVVSPSSCTASLVANCLLILSLVTDFNPPLSQHNWRTPRFFAIRISNLDPHKALVGMNPVDFPCQSLTSPAPVIYPTEIRAKRYARYWRALYGDPSVLNVYIMELGALSRIEPAGTQRFQDRRHG